VLVAASIAVAACGESAPAASPAASPEEALTRLVGFIADDQGSEACASMLAVAQNKFGPDNDASDCESAVTILSSQVTDKEAFRAMVPSGLEVEGDTAEVSGYCNDGWTNPDGSRSQLDFSPNDLGTLTLRRAEDGWMVSDYLGAKNYSTCG
jgi:hypothetical protein